jgi:hypothetical protein
MFSHAICKKGTGKGFLQLANVHHSQRKCSLHTDVLQVKLKILHPECFLADHLQHKDVYYAEFILQHAPPVRNAYFITKNILETTGRIVYTLAQRGDAVS